MRKIKYLIKRVFEMDFKAMFKTAKRVSKIAKKPSIVILFDIIYCGYKYMAGYVDYEVFCFYYLNKAQRETMITRGINNRFVQTLNDKNYTDLLDNKLMFNEKFNKFLKRDWLDLNKASYEEFETYAKTKKSFIAKPVDLACGRNIIKVVIEDNTNLKELYDSLIENKQLLLEDYIIQHPEMAKIYPTAVNTLRIVSVTKDGNTHIMFRSIRMGNSGNVVDNFNHGGLFTTIEPDGTIVKPAVDKKGNIYESHPYTNTKLIGFKIPMFEEALDYVKEMCKEIPQVGYVGWDIAITENGPLVVEANPFPGHDIYQSKIHMNEDGTGMRQEFEKIIFG